MIFATSTFLQVIFAVMIVVPIVLLWVFALVDVIRSGRSGLAIAALIVVIFIVPILGPLAVHEARSRGRSLGLRVFPDAPATPAR